ncbi:ATP-binding cassette domain-containing protein [Halorientalis regularis]|jgi:ABC-2 type transport system ATP-binding protein|uniref:ABC-2 type transport system ATP-binding protein n=1 Tax=Halorientalis regularis TaxID=660518 RepID=A0A1G7SD59_9EURY|nr:ABC transporter ATP-binding protein [Halorientalis regularis]SDG20986.1 ABC-2 type transport system ATP-binding protein [Halorientalis regularis]
MTRTADDDHRNDHDPILELHAVSKSYGDVTALSGVDLSVAPGTIHALVGPNGSGKTTLFRIALGLTRPSSGTVDAPVEGIGPGFQRANFYRDLTVAENLDVFAALTGAEDEAWREEICSTLRLDRVRDRRAGDLSGGFGKKLDLALALLNRSPVVCLDEPMGDLDDVSKANLLDLLADYRDEGHAVVVSTHHLGAFADVIDHLTVLHDGEVLLDDPRGAIDLGDHDSLQDLYVARSLAADRGSTGDT